TRSRILTRAKRKVLELDGHAVSPQSGNPHRYTLIYLHGLGGCGADYLHADSELCWPWRLGPSYAPGLRAVFPSAPLQQQPWGETLPSWYQYQGIASNELAMPEQLAAVQEALDEVIRQEIERLEAPGCVFLGGVSQGCNVALDAYLRHDLGGFAGSVGFLPGDSWGFEGADRRLRRRTVPAQTIACGITDCPPKTEFFENMWCATTTSATWLKYRLWRQHMPVLFRTFLASPTSYKVPVTLQS
ncbi:Acyl-protein thioesterase 1, partial [Durusdinium trenchii]